MVSRALLFIAVLLAFGASLTHGFHFDDYSVIHGAPWPSWQTRPLTWFSFLLNARISSHPPLWHLVSVGAHLGAVLLLYQLLLKLLPAEAALLAAAVFAVHPIQAESVAYVFSRSTLFSTALSIGACLFWMQGRRWFAVAAFALALTAKEDCATLPLVILLFDWRAVRQAMRKKLTPIGAMTALSLAAGVTTLLQTQRLANTGAGFSAGVSPSFYLFSQGYVICRYLRLLIVPYGFTVDPEIRFSSNMAIIAWIFLASLVCFLIWRKERWLLAGLLLLIPSSSVFPLADLAADHRMYLPMAAFAGYAGLWLARLPRYLPVMVILALIGVSAARMHVWENDERLWTEAVTRGPDRLRPYLQLARALEPGHAVTELLQVQTRFPGRPEVDAELGRVYLEMGQPALALGEFGKVLGQNPGDPRAINNRGVALRALGQEDAAKLDFDRALKIDPCLADARQNLGLPLCH